MLTLAETPQALLSQMSVALAEIRDPRARHWLILPGRGRAEAILHLWAQRSGIAAHTQEVELRVLIEQAASGEQRKRFDFDRLRLVCASILHEFAHLSDFPIHGTDPLTPVTASVLTWATTVAKAIDDGLQCRSPSDCWAENSFLDKIHKHPAVTEALQSHIGALNSTTFEQSTRSWIQSWTNRGGIPHLWIQLDSGIPTVQYERLQQFLQILSEEHRDHIHLFALAPSREYWGDSPIRARKSEHNDDPDLHPGALLWALGQSSQDLHQQLSETFLSYGDGGLWLESPPPAPSLLGQLQRSCRSSKPIPPEERAALNPNDTSLTIHSTRSTLRELEVCRDRILQARHESPDLRYEDILLLLADPKRQAPYIQAALRSDDPKHPYIPFRMLGFGQTVPSPLAESLTLLIEKLRGRLNLEDIQTLVENPLIAAKFGFEEATQDRLDVIAWLKDAQFRWGLESAHRREFQNIPENRWNLVWAIQRLGLGAIVAPEHRNELLTLSAGGGDAVPLERASGLSLATLARLARFTSALLAARSIWCDSNPNTIPFWNKKLIELAETFLDCTTGASALHQTKLFTSILPQLERAVEGMPFELKADAFIRITTEKLESISEGGSRGSGGICVADLRQYAGVPARLTLIAGLDDGLFPRRDDRPDWHPLSQSRKPGDPSLREADRHALLLSILACQERLVLSYQGGSDEDAKHRPPSTALADLIKAVQENCFTPDSQIQLEFEHPLNGFSTVSFASKRPPSARNHLTQDYSAAQQLEARTKLHPYPGLWSEPLPPSRASNTRQKLATSTLRDLLQEPGRLLLNRLGIRLPETPAELESGDLLDSNNLHRWALRDIALTSSIEGKDLACIRRRLEVAGEIPRAQIGENLWNKIIQELPVPLTKVHPSQKLSGVIRVALPPYPTEEQSYTIEGSLNGHWYVVPDEQKAIFLSPSSFSYKQDLFLTLETLLLAASTPDDSHSLHRVEAYYRSTKKPKDRSLPTPERAIHLLQRLLPLFELAQQIALPFWPEAAEAALKATLLKTPPITNPTSQDVEAALEQAYSKWATTTEKMGPGPCDSPTTRYLFRGCSNPLIWTPPLANPLQWLPDPHAPLAWRISVFLHQWKIEADQN
ncbi:MAG: exodeoxyribonuclease V subunit gamma [Verrucomicrobiota bacterium]